DSANSWIFLSCSACAILLRSSSHGEREPALRVTQMNAVLIQPIDGLRHPAAVPCVTASVHWRRIGVKHTSGSQGRIKTCNFSLVQAISCNKNSVAGQERRLVRV